MNKSMAAKLREEVRDKIKPLCEEYGINFELGKCRYNEFRIRFEVRIFDETFDDDGNEQTPEAYKYREKAARYGLKQSYLFRKFEYRPTPKSPVMEFQVVGLMDEKERPVLVKEVKTGKEWDYSVENIIDVFDPSD